MLKHDYSFRVNKIQQLLGGMKARADELETWGYPPEFIAELSQIQGELEQLQNLRNATKAAGKAATTKQNELLREAEKRATMVRQTVRARLPKEDWNQFGFYPGEFGVAKFKEPAHDQE